MSTPQVKRPQPPSNAGEMLARGREWLAARGLAESRLDAEILVGHALGLDRLGLFMNLERAIAPEEMNLARELLQRRSKGEPTAYLTGVREFYGRPFSVKSGVLIPRPETELLVDLARERLAPKNFEAEAVEQEPAESSEGNPAQAEVSTEPEAAPSPKPERQPELHIGEFGTGSGCLAITLHLELEAHVTASDVSEAALEVARSNAEQLKASERLSFVHGDGVQALLDAVSQPLDLLVSNPPYVDPATAGELSAEVRDHEPAQALFAPEGQLDHWALELCRLGLSALKPGASLLIELGADQASRLSEQLSNAGAWPLMESFVFHQDLNGHERVLEVVRA